MNPSRSGERWRRMGVNAIAGGVGRVVSALCGLVQATVAVQHLGASVYGLLCTVMAFATVVNFADLGLGSVQQTALADAFGHDDDATLRTRFVTGFALHAALGVLWLAPLLALSLLIDWPRMLHLDAVTTPLAPAGVLISVFAICAGLPLTVATRLAYALQLGWLHAWWTAVGNAVTLLAFLGAARMGGGFVTFTLIGTGGALATNLGLMLHLWLRLRWTTNLVKFYNSGEARALVRRGAIYATPQVSGAALTAALPTLLSSAGGPGAVTIYNLIQRLFGLVTQAHSVIVAPFWTAYAEAAARRDFRWIGQAFALLSIATLALFFPVLVLGTVQIGPLLRAWVPNAPPIPSQMFVVWVAVWCAAQMLGLVFQNLLLGLNRLHGLALFSTGGSVVAVFAMALLGHTHGATGVLAGLALGFGLVGVLGMGLQCIRVLRTGASL